jgi:hypothetical protein
MNRVRIRDKSQIEDVLLGFLFIFTKYMFVCATRSRLPAHHQGIMSSPANTTLRGSIDPGVEATILMSTAFVILFGHQIQLLECFRRNAYRTFQASMSSPMPEPIRIIQLVSVLLSMRYSKITSCTKTFVMI